MMLRRTVVLVLLCGAVGCSSPPKASEANNENNGDGCEALRVAVAMSCVDTCSGSGGNDFPDTSADAGGSSEPTSSDMTSNAPPPPDFGSAPDIGNGDPIQPFDMGAPPPDFGIPQDVGTPDVGTDPVDSGFEFAGSCELTLNQDGTISEWHGDNEEGGTWSCSDGVLRIDNVERGRQSYVLGSDGCLQGPDYNYN